jgi:hypothetical protein
MRGISRTQNAGTSKRQSRSIATAGGSAIQIKGILRRIGGHNRLNDILRLNQAAEQAQRENRKRGKQVHVGN